MHGARDVSRALWVGILLVAFSAVPDRQASAAEEADHKIDLAELMRDTQKMSPDPNRMALAWWIPVEFWEATMSQDPTVSPAQAREVVEVLSPYTVICAIRGKIGPFGGMTFASEEDVRADIRLVDRDKVPYKPLEPDKVSPDAANLLAAMKPMLANAMGRMGQSMHFFVFPAKDKKGRKIADAKKAGKFWVHLGEEKHRWRLPLGSLLPKKTCTVCGEELSGAYNYCPYDGRKLPEPAVTVPKEETPQEAVEETTVAPEIADRAS